MCVHQHHHSVIETMKLQQYMDMQKMVQRFIDEALSESPRCKYPECCEVAIASHVLQKEGPLRRIASTDGKVMCVDKLRGLLKYARRMHDAECIVPPELSKVGIGDATTYPGFCKHHDGEVFRSIECGDPLRIGNQEQLVALYRRVFFYMMHISEQYLRIGEKLAEECDNNALREMRRVLIPDYIALATEFLPRTWSNNLAGNLKYEWRIIKRNVGVACASRILVDSVKSYEIAARPFTTFSLIPECNKTHAILIWDSCFDDKMQSLKCQMGSNVAAELSRTLNELTFAKGTDYCISPDLWQSLSEEEHSIVHETLRNNVIRKNSSNIPNIIMFSDNDLIAC